MTQDVDIRRRRAKFRANHRGTKEMDWMLGRFADARLESMVDPQLGEFELFLTVADPEINNWLLDPQSCPQPQYRPLVDAIRAFHDLGDAA